MEEMKITILVRHLRETWYMQVKNKNISIDLKQKIYEAYNEKCKNQSKNKFCEYLKGFWIWKTSTKEIIKIWDKNYPKSLEFSFWEKYEKNNYKERYKNTNRTKKTATLTEKQTKYIIELRDNEPNKWYKLFENGLFIPENKENYEEIFWKEAILSKRTFYDIIKENNLPHRITKRQKIWLLAQHKKNNTLETYLWEMHHIYCWYKALHRWQVDIKYLTDIPNYVTLWLFDIYLYEITFRDYKTWLTICYFWDDKSKSSVLIAFEIFKKMMFNIWVNFKDITFQFDWWAEFSNIRINDIKWALIEMIERDFWWYNLINRKEQNWHVETFHRRIEEDLFDTKYISNLKEKINNKEITKQELRGEILKLLNKYILNFNNYWYSSYKPRYAVFWKKSPIMIAKEDWKKEIEQWTININFLEKYAWAYDITRAYSLVRIQDYSNIVNAKMMILENKFDFAVNSIRLISDNYLSQFYEFLNPDFQFNKSGRIWNGTIDVLLYLLLPFYFSLFGLKNMIRYLTDQHQLYKQKLCCFYVLNQ